MDLDDLSAYMQKAVSENPALEMVPPQKSAYDAEFVIRTQFGGSRAEYKSPDVAAPVNTVEELEQQLRLSEVEPPVRRLAVRMLHTLSSKGYFTQPLEAFASDAGATLDEAQRALSAIQALEPAGVGARTVEECLCLQLRERPDADPLCYELIARYLPEIGRGNLRQIARETGTAMARVRACVETIRSLTPAPCSFHTEAVQYIRPEFSVEAHADGRVTVIFHNDYYPSFRQDERFRRLSDTLSGEELAFARRMQTSASQLIRAAEMRQSTMEKVAGIIAREQRAFFLGEYSLLPLRIDEAAREMGVHETTVYRALQGKYLYCARGMFPLSHFFQREVSDGISTERVKELIREICMGNGKVSDRAITEALEKRGVRLSRRTVAKYRAQMNIDSSFRRSTEEKE